MNRARPEPALAAAVAVAAWLAVLSPAPAAIRAPAAIALLGILPGYALLEAVGLGRSMDVVEKALLAVGASLSIVVVLSVVIGLSVAQLKGPVVSSVLTGLILGMLGIPWIVDRRTSSEDASPRNASARWVPSQLRIRRSGAGWVIGAALAVGALAVAVISSQSTGADVVQFWATRGPGGVTVGIRNDLPTTSTYRLTIGPSGADEDSQDVVVSSGQQWQGYVTSPATWPPGAAVVANLYAAGATTPFRTVRLAPQQSSSS